MGRGLEALANPDKCEENPSTHLPPCLALTRIIGRFSLNMTCAVRARLQFVLEQSVRGVERFAESKASPGSDGRL